MKNQRPMALGLFRSTRSPAVRFDENALTGGGGEAPAVATTAGEGNGGDITGAGDSSTSTSESVLKVAVVDVEGMTCAICVGIVENLLKRCSIALHSLTCRSLESCPGVKACVATAPRVACKTVFFPNKSFRPTQGKRNLGHVHRNGFTFS